MIWHIFRKDWRLLWPLVMIAAASYAANIWIWLILGHFGEPRELRQIAALLPYLVNLGTAIVIAAAIHQDPIPGDHQDWLTRPIYRHHLLLAKFLFIALSVLLPMFAMDVGTVLLNGFAASDAIRASAGRTLTLFCFVCLPAIALAAVTRTLIEVIVVASATFVAVAAILFTKNIVDPGNPPATGGVQWTVLLLTGIAIVTATAGVLALQYGRRRTISAQGLIAATVALGVVILFTPFKPVFKFHTWLRPNSTVDVAVNPHSPKDATPLVQEANSAEYNAQQVVSLLGAKTVSLPLQITGLPSNSFLGLDLAEVSFWGADGKLIYLTPQYLGGEGIGRLLSTRFSGAVRQGSGASGTLYIRQLVYLPSKTYEQMQNQPVRVEIDYAMTLFAQQPTENLAAVGSDARLADGSWCKTRMDSNGDAIGVGCRTPNDLTGCLSGILENPITGLRNPESFQCSPNYSPLRSRTFPMVLGGFGRVLKFRDLDGLAKYPVDEAQVTGARVLLTEYIPISHMTRHITIPNVHLSDWDLPVMEGTAAGLK